MTTIACDGKILAVDSQVTTGNSVAFYTNKLMRWSDGYFALCGDFQHNGAFKAWLEKAHTSSERVPPETGGAFEDMSALFTDGDGVLYEVGDQLWPWESKIPAALGSGADIALTVMRRGGTAVEAVREACKYDIHTGGRVNWVKISG